MELFLVVLYQKTQVNNNNKAHLRRSSHSLANLMSTLWMPFFFFFIYLKGDIHDIGVELGSICVCLRLWVCPLQHVGHTHSAGVFLCNWRLWETQLKSTFFDWRTTEEPVLLDIWTLRALVLKNCVNSSRDSFVQQQINKWTKTADEHKRGKNSHELIL